MDFAKYHGAGNDFILIDDRQETFSIADVKKLCDRNLGIGADGVILVQHSKIADFRFRLFNQDGGEAELSGNGMRCFVQFLTDLGEKVHTVETLAGLRTCGRRGGKIAINMGKPKDLYWGVEVPGCDGAFVVDTGVPHCVIFVPHIEEVDVHTWGSQVRAFPLFGPRGTNVTFVQIESEDLLLIRTYERGVEKETLACGSGAAAAAYVAHKLEKASSQVRVIPTSKEPIDVEVDEEVGLIGSAVKVFEGAI